MKVQEGCVKCVRAIGAPWNILLYLVCVSEFIEMD